MPLRKGKRLVLTEIGREAATLVLIFTAAWLFGGVPQERIAYFLIIFAVWDIFYYVWLKVLLDWPATLMDWDILFLIPRGLGVPRPVPGPRIAGHVRIRRRDPAPLRNGRPLMVTRLDGLGWSALPAGHRGRVLPWRDAHDRAELRGLFSLAAVRPRLWLGRRHLRQVPAWGKARNRGILIGRIGPM